MSAYAAMSGHSSQIAQRALIQAAVICRPLISVGWFSGGRKAFLPKAACSARVLARQASTAARPVSGFMIGPPMLAAIARRPRTGSVGEERCPKGAHGQSVFACGAGQSEHSRFSRSCWFSRSVSGLADAVKRGVMPG